MKYYQDITLLPDPETDLYFLWQMVFQQMHLALVEIKDETDQVPVGFCWPNYIYSKNRKHLGNKLRVFAGVEHDLKNLNVLQWLSRFMDYVHVTQIRDVPENVEKFVSFRRVQTKHGKECLARRKAKREGISFQQAINQFDSFNEKWIDLPFIITTSLSGHQRFPLFISKQEAPRLEHSKFSCYGLSAQGSLPWF